MSSFHIYMYECKADKDKINSYLPSQIRVIGKQLAGIVCLQVKFYWF